MILPKDKCDLEDSETRGLWKAIALSKTIGSGDRVLDATVILDIHRAILGEAMPSAAGRFRVAGEDVKKLNCIEPPPGISVAEIHRHAAGGDQAKGETCGTFAFPVSGWHATRWDTAPSGRRGVVSPVVSPGPENGARTGPVGEFAKKSADAQAIQGQVDAT